MSAHEVAAVPDFSAARCRNSLFLILQLLNKSSHEGKGLAILSSRTSRGPGLLFAIAEAIMQSILSRDS